MGENRVSLSLTPTNPAAMPFRRRRAKTYPLHESGINPKNLQGWSWGFAVFASRLNYGKRVNSNVPVPSLAAHVMVSSTQDNEPLGDHNDISDMAL